MDWSYLLLLACPLMMLFCMKGMFSGNKEKDAKAAAEQSQVSAQELQSLQIKMADLMEENHKLAKEVQSMKAHQYKQESVSNVVKLKEEQDKKAKQEVS